MSATSFNFADAFARHAHQAADAKMPEPRPLAVKVEAEQPASGRVGKRRGAPRGRRPLGKQDRA